MKCSVLSVLLSLILSYLSGFAQTSVKLENKDLKLSWSKTSQGYKLSGLVFHTPQGEVNIENPIGEYTLLYSKEAPDTESGILDSNRLDLFKAYAHAVKIWHEALKPVPLNTAGKAVTFFPEEAVQTKNGLQFKQETADMSIEAIWRLDAQYPSDVLVEMRLRAKNAGYYAIASPTLYTVKNDELDWAILPGYFQGKTLESNLALSYGYGQGIPDKPVIVRERVASTLAPLIQNKEKVSLAVIPEPGTGRDPWSTDHFTHNDWKLGLSLMNRKGELTPTLYHPVLGEVNSYMQKGEERVFKFRYALQRGDWFNLYKHAIYDVYQFKHFLDLKDTDESLTHRIYAMLDYLKSDSTSLWETHSYQGMEIGAQAYLGAVVGSEKDAMKNSDYGAMWMAAKLSNDEVLNKERLPYARNFKLVQQQQEDGFFKGAAVGQYYLWKSKRFTEEWGDYVEPIALTYYTLLDVGNILLFQPQDQELRERLRAGADKLLAWQKADGSWEVAYDRETTQPVFRDLKDLRPTFYGLLVAYRVLGDEKYLKGARKGADWLLAQAVNKGFFLGVCGDARFAPDFATGQSAQAFLDLYDITHKEAYLTAAKETARLYTASVYTHPIATAVEKTVKGKKWADWQISQVGLSFEHGGLLGSANGAGPILLASHAGMFVRMFALTQDSIFIDMARAAAWGRDAFVDPATHVASYYWKAMNAGPGPFPHHAWWQIGWITDYLLSEASLRSNNQIHFPSGFVTPKVGPHQPYGFQEGTIFGLKANLLLPQKGIAVQNERIDYVCAQSEDKKHFFLVLINNSTEEEQASVSLHFPELMKEQLTPKEGLLLDEDGKRLSAIKGGAAVNEVSLPAFGLRVLKFNY